MQTSEFSDTLTSTGLGTNAVQWKQSTLNAQHKMSQPEQLGRRAMLRSHRPDSQGGGVEKKAGESGWCFRTSGRRVASGMRRILFEHNGDILDLVPVSE